MAYNHKKHLEMEHKVLDKIYVKEATNTNILLDVNFLEI